MTVKKIILCIAAVVLLCTGCQNHNKASSNIPDTTGMFTFTVLKIGKADAIILQTQKHNVIIDCGEKSDGNKIAEYLTERGILNVDCLFVTHFDKDHVGGFPDIVENVTVSDVFVPNYDGNNGEYKKYLKAADKTGLKITRLTEDISFTLDDVLLEVSVPKKQSYIEDDNDFSLVVSITHGENTFLFAGDAEEERLSELMTEINHTYDFLKVPHHGRYNKNTDKFINVVKPKYSVICDSEKNPAEDDTLSSLEKVGSAVYSTKDGDVNVSSDGKEVKIAQ